MFAIVYPAIDPILIEIGPFAIRWYALAYVVGIVLGWRYTIRLARHSPAGIEVRDIDDYIVWLTLGIAQGGQQVISPVACLWFAAIPIFDCLTCFTRRALRGKSPFSPGRDHFHHTLNRGGFGVRQISPESSKHPPTRASTSTATR